MLLFSQGDRAVELDQHQASRDLVAVLHMNRRNDTRFERLDGLCTPGGTIFPGAAAMMSTRPNVAHAIAIAKNRMISPPMARPTGDARVSKISNAAGKKCRAVSSLLYVGRRFSSWTTLDASACDMRPCLNLVKASVAPGFLCYSEADSPVPGGETPASRPGTHCFAHHGRRRWGTIASP